MYKSIWDIVHSSLSEERMKSEVVDFFGFSRWSSYGRIGALAQLIAARMEAAGMEDVRLIMAPADGRTSFGGWVVPRAYDVEEATLFGIVDDAIPEVLADYAVNPTCLMLYSMPTEPTPLQASLIVADLASDLAPERVEGRIVLTSAIGVEFAEAAMRAGAIGLVSDCRSGKRFIKDGPYLDDTNEWHNFTIPPWHDPGKGFGFAISPRQGQRLREALASGREVRVRATVKTRHYDGVLPVVSGILRGLSDEEIVLTGHFDENGADDNCSQIAVALEAVRALRSLPNFPLKRSVRLIFPMEVRGLNALIQDPAETRKMRAGLNIDTVGTDQNRDTSTCVLLDTLMAAPSFADDFAAELLDRVAAGNPLFRWRRVDAEVIDNILGEPLVGSPTPAIYHFNGTHHTPLDTPDRISGRMLLDMAALTATYAAFLANAGLREALWLADLSAMHGERRIRCMASDVLRDCTAERLSSLLRKAYALQQDYAERLRSLKWLVPTDHTMPAELFTSPEGSTLIGDERLLPDEALSTRIRQLECRLDRVRGEMRAQLERQAREHFGVGVWTRRQNGSGSVVVDIAAPPAIPHSEFVPEKTFRGYLSFEDMDAEERQQELPGLEIPFGWGSPMWLQDALQLANGKRTVSEIRLMLLDRGASNLPRLEPIFKFLERRGLVRKRPYVTRADVSKALRTLGLKPGDLVLAHFSLSQFGYIEGGADGMIEAVLDVIGPAGTLVVPAFSFSWIGRPPFEPLNSPSRVGAVSDAFWRRPGVVRSHHPTHSFAASGPLAEVLLNGHDHGMAPLSRSGPVGKVADGGGKILMLAPLRSNTSMHAGEYWAGTPYPDLPCSILEDGVRREVLVPECPWHVMFDRAYEILRERSLLSEAPLGESVVYLMASRDAVEAQSQVAQEAPQTLVQPGCECLYCRRVAEWAARRGEWPAASNAIAGL